MSLKIITLLMNLRFAQSVYLERVFMIVLIMFSVCISNEVMITSVRFFGLRRLGWGDYTETVSLCRLFECERKCDEGWTWHYYLCFYDKIGWDLIVGLWNVKHMILNRDVKSFRSLELSTKLSLLAFALFFKERTTSAYIKGIVSYNLNIEY